MNTVVYKSRITLIRIGKILPFVMCTFIFFSYFESISSLFTNDVVLCDNYTILRKPFSLFIGNYFEYNIQTLVIITIISIAVETCIYNKLSCVYLGINLFEKSFFEFEMDAWLIYLICISNILVAGFLVYKGLIRLNNS